MVAYSGSMTPDSMAALLAEFGDSHDITYAEVDGRWQLIATPWPPVASGEPVAADTAAALAEALREQRKASR